MSKKPPKLEDTIPGQPIEDFVEEFLIKPVYGPPDPETGEIEMVSAGIHRDGKEYGDPIPMEPPIGYTTPPGLREMFSEMIRNHEFQRRQAEAGVETFEEAGDFEVDDDPMLKTPYERFFDPPPPPVEPATPQSGNPPLAAKPSDPGKAGEGGGGGGSPEPAPAPPPKPSAST